MCEVTTVMAVLSVASTAFAVNANIQQGKYRKGVAEYNARVKENEAQEVRRAGVEEENIQRRKTAELLSTQRAKLGASGIDLDSGSAFQLQQDTATLGEVDALRIRSNFETRADALGTGALLTRQQGGYAQRAGTNQAVGTLLGGTAQVLDTGVADKWFKPDSAANQPVTLEA